VLEPVVRAAVACGVQTGCDGKMFHAARKKHSVSQNGGEQALRGSECDLAELRCAFLEVDGSVSIQKCRPQARA